MSNILDTLNTNISMWIVVGVLSGLIIYLADSKESKGGVFLTAVFGVQGAVVSGFLYSLFFGLQTVGFDLASFLMAIVGGLLISFSQRLILRKDQDYENTYSYEPWFNPLFSPVGQKGGKSSSENVQEKNQESTKNVKNIEIQGNGIKKEEEQKEEEDVRWF